MVRPLFTAWPATWLLNTIMPRRHSLFMVVISVIFFTHSRNSCSDFVLSGYFHNSEAVSLLWLWPEKTGVCTSLRLVQPCWFIRKWLCRSA